MHISKFAPHPYLKSCRSMLKSIYKLFRLDGNKLHYYIFNPFPDYFLGGGGGGAEGQ